MRAKEFKPGRFFLGRLQHDADLLKDILSFAKREGVNLAAFSAIGAIRRVVLAYYNQDSKSYQDMSLDKPMEMVSCWGNLTSLEGKPHLHAHGIFADDKGHTIAGHIQPGTILFAGEILLQELLGEPLHRQYDAITGLSLWNI